MNRVALIAIVVLVPLLALTQTDARNVCVVSGECIGAACNQRSQVFPEGESIVRNLNSRSGKMKLNAIYQPDVAPGCKAAVAIRCEYVVAVRPVKLTSSQPLRQSQMDAVNRDRLQPSSQPAPPPAGAQASEDLQRQSLDQASLSFQIIRTSDCASLFGGEVSKLEADALSLSDQTVSYLTSKAAEKIRTAIEKDKKKHP